MNCGITESQQRAGASNFKGKGCAGSGGRWIVTRVEPKERRGLRAVDGREDFCYRGFLPTSNGDGRSTRGMRLENRVRV